MAIKISGTTVIDDNRNVSSVGIATVGSGSSTTTINGNTGIVNVGTGVTINGITGNISIAGTISAAGFNIPASITSLNPANGATNVSLSTSITLNFDQVVGIATAGNVFIRQGSAGGTTLQTIGTGSISVGSDNRSIIISLTSNLPASTSIVPVIPNGIIKSTSGDFVGVNTTGGISYSFTTRAVILGDPYEGGFLICQASSTRWIVAPSSSEVSRNWYSVGDASTRAQQVSGCTGWFVPSCGQLQNPGYTCRTFWNSYSSTLYWSSTSGPIVYGFYVNMANGVTSIANRTCTFCVRAFRCVTY